MTPRLLSLRLLALALGFVLALPALAMLVYRADRLRLVRT